MTGESAFVYRFEPGSRAGAPPFLLLHGTGGDENDLLQLGAMISRRRSRWGFPTVRTSRPRYF